MPILYGSAEDGEISSINNSSWAGARDAVTGSGARRNDTQSINAVRASRNPARGGGYSWRVYRSFFMFDVSGISATPVSADFYLHGYISETADFFLVKSDYDPDSFIPEEFDSIVGWTTGSSDGSGAGDNESNVTKYSDEFDVSEDWDNGSSNRIGLTAGALSDMVSLDNFRICLIESVHDLRDIEADDVFWTGVAYQEYSGTSRDPYITYETTVAAADNATFFGANF